MIRRITHNSNNNSFDDLFHVNSKYFSILNKITNFFTILNKITKNAFENQLEIASYPPFNLKAILGQVSFIFLSCSASSFLTCFM